VEGELSAALATVLRSPDSVRLTVAGRTDAGVHARGQVAHVDVARSAWAAVPGRSDRSPEEALRVRLAGVLPVDIAVSRVAVAPAGFDARFSATSRRYLYRLADDLATHDPLRRRDTVQVRGHLDPQAMSDAGYLLVGLHDFAAYCRHREGATTIRTLLALSWERHADGVVQGTVVADAFCHSMVRALVGALVPVGEGKRDVDWPAEVLTAGIRDPAVRVMPPHGLSLEEVTYPPDAELAARATESRATRIAE
jgi:tRNA pseudouridine38-40 synthase